MPNRRRASAKEMLLTAALTVATALLLLAVSMSSGPGKAFANPEPEGPILPAEMPLDLDEIQDFDSFNVLVFTYTAGFRHTDGINTGRTVVQNLGTQYGFNVTLSEDRTLFSEAGLAPFDVVMFLNTTTTSSGRQDICPPSPYQCGDLLNAAQQTAFENWYRQGKGWVGAHAASDTEKPEDNMGVSWPWYGGLLGNNAWFLNHGGNNDQACLVKNPNEADHLSVNNPLITPTWQMGNQTTVADEWYSFKNNPLNNITPTTEVPHTPINVVQYRPFVSNTQTSTVCANATYPASWYHEYDGGRSFYTSRGHQGSRWNEADFQKHVLGALVWASGVTEIEDETAPVTTHALNPASGPYTGPVTVTLTATDPDPGRGVDKVYRRIGGAGPYTEYTAPFQVTGNGTHTVEYYAVDKAGNQETTKSFQVTIAGTGDITPPTSSHVLNPATPNGSNGWYTSDVVVDLNSADNAGGSGVASMQYSLNNGPWTPYALGGGVPSGEEMILNSAADLTNWIQYQPGGFTWNASEGGFARGTGGMGLLWLPVEYGDFSLKMQWRDSTPAGNGNSGVFVRFPDLRGSNASKPTTYTYNWPGPTPAAQQYNGNYCGRYSTANGDSDNARIWWAIYCGNEIQINDWSSDARKTGSIYSFKDNNASQGNPQGQLAGVWVDYEVKVVGQQYEIYRNGALINSLNFAVPLASSRAGDPPTQARQFARGYVGLQNHSNTEVIDFRNVRITRLDNAETVLTLNQDGTHVLQYRATDADGNTETVKSTPQIRIDKTAPTTTASFSPVFPGAGGTYGGPVSISLAATDPASGSGVGTTQYRIGTDGNFVNYTAPVQFSAEGTYTVQFRTTDQAGNIESTKQVAFAIGEPGACVSPANDEFDGSVLNPKWENMRPNATNPVSLSNGELVLPFIQGGDVYGGEPIAHNLLLQSAPAGTSWVATLKAKHADMNNEDKSVGIAVVNNISPNYFAKVAMQHKGDTDPNTGGNQPGLWSERVLTVNGSAITTPPDTVPYPNSGALTPQGDSLWVRIVYDAGNNMYSSWTSLDGVTFIKYGTDFPGSGLTQNGGAIRIGVFAKKGGATGANGSGKIDYFRLVDGVANPQLPVDCEEEPEPGDEIPPVTTASVNPQFPNGGAGWYLTAPSVTLSATDNETPAGQIEKFWRFGTSGAFQAYTGPIAVPNDFDGTIQYYSEDAEENAETVKSLSLKVDLTAPTVSHSFTADAPFTPSNPAQLVLTANDAGSGVETVQVKIGDGLWTTYSDDNRPTFPAAGSYTVQYRGIDVAGNESAAQSVTVEVVNPQAPTLTLVSKKTLNLKANAKKGKVKLRISNPDGVSGVKVCVKHPTKVTVPDIKCQNVNGFNSNGFKNITATVKPKGKKLRGKSVKVRFTIQAPGYPSKTVTVTVKQKKK